MQSFHGSLPIQQTFAFFIEFYAESYDFAFVRPERLKVFAVHDLLDGSRLAAVGPQFNPSLIPKIIFNYF